MRAEVRERAARLGLRLAPEAALPELQDIDTLQANARPCRCVTVTQGRPELSVLMAVTASPPSNVPGTGSVRH